MTEALEAWVVYDSVHGNTRSVAEAVAEGLASGGPVHVVAAGDVDLERLPGARAVVLGCPTHAFSLSLAMKELAAALTNDRLAGVPIATFDTRFARDAMPNRFLQGIVRVLGKRAWAATELDRRAARAGASRLAEPEGFVVRDVEGPLADGELERANAWGRELLRRLA